MALPVELAHDKQPHCMESQWNPGVVEQARVTPIRSEDQVEKPSYTELAHQRYRGACPFYFDVTQAKVEGEVPKDGRLVLIDSLVSPELNYCLVLLPESTVAEVAAAYLTFIRSVDPKTELTNVHFSVAPFEYLSVGKPTEKVAAMQGQVIFPVWQRRRHLWTSTVLSKLEDIMRCLVCGAFIDTTEPEQSIRIYSATACQVACLECAVTDEWLDQQACWHCGLRNRPAPKAFDRNAIVLRCDDCSEERCLKCGTASKEHLCLCQVCGRAPYCNRECQRADWQRHRQECHLPAIPWQTPEPAAENLPEKGKDAPSPPQEQAPSQTQASSP